MENIRPRETESETNKEDGASYISWNKNDEASKSNAFKSYAQSSDEFFAIARSTTEYVGYDNTSNSIKSSFHRGDYEYVRPNEATPWKSKDIIKKSIEICENIGRINDIFSLMADFSCQGITLEHPVPATDRLYKNWFAKINGPERSERFCYYLLKQANVPIYRTYGKVNVKDVSKWKKTHSTNAASPKKVDGITVKENRIPSKYKFLNIMTIEPEHGDDNPLYGLDINEKYFLKITKSLQDIVRSPSASGLSRPIRRLGIISGEVDRVELKKDNFSVYFYKKDDWRPWADPILRPIFTNVAMLRKLELADVSALDGIISSVRLWRLGDLDHELIPNKAMLARLRAVLAANSGGGPLDLVWGPDIDFKDSSTDAHKFLGSDKYVPVLDAIYSGLGVPPALRGQSGEGLGNNFISLQTFIERLQYIRSVLVEFWTNELKLVQAALKLPSLPKIMFDKMVLGDESAEKQLLLSLVDRGIVSEEAVLRYCGFSPDMELARNMREDKAREKGKKGPKASPFHNPHEKHDLRKIFSQQGVVTPSEVGLELDERVEGEDTKLETMTKTQLELAKQKGAGSGSSNLDNNKPVGENNGRPKNSKDSTKRKQKTITPQTKAFMNAYSWSTDAYQAISGIITPKYLKDNNKKDVRSLSASQKQECEDLKAAYLFSLPLYSHITRESVYNFLDNPVAIPEDIITEINAAVNDVRETTGKNATIEDVRDICAIMYSLINKEE